MAVNTNDPTIRQTNVAVLFGLQVDENTPLALDPTLHAIPVEADSVTYGTPWTQEDSNEATGSYVAGAPLIIGQSTPISFRFRIKGAGPNVVYSSTVKPPHHAVLQAAGWRGRYLWLETQKPSRGRGEGGEVTNAEYLQANERTEKAAKPREMMGLRT